MGRGEGHRHRRPGRPCCHPAPTRGKPGTSWKAWPSCPTGFSEDNRDSTVGRLAKLLWSFSHFCTLGAAGWLADAPPGGQAPSRVRSGPRPSIRQKTDGSSSSRTRGLGAQGTLGTGPGRPGPPLCIPRHTTASRRRLSPGRKSVRPPDPRLPSRCSTAVPRCSCLLASPLATPFLTGPGRPRPLISLPRGARCQEGERSSVSSQCCGRLSSGKATTSPRHAPGPKDGHLSPSPLASPGGWSLCS